MPLADMLNELGQAMRLGPLALDESNLCRLVFDNELAVVIEHVPARGRFFLHAVVGTAPEDGSPILAEMLAANLFGHGTGDAVLALDRQAGEVLLFRAFDEETADYRSFAAGLELFLRSLEGWKARLARAEAIGAAEPDGQAAAPAGFTIRA